MQKPLLFSSLEHKFVLYESQALANAKQFTTHCMVTDSTQFKAEVQSKSCAVITLLCPCLHCWSNQSPRDFGSSSRKGNPQTTAGSTAFKMGCGVWGRGGTGRARSDVLSFCRVCFCSCVVCVRRHIPCTFLTTDTKTRKFVKNNETNWSSDENVVQWVRTAICVSLFYFIFCHLLSSSSFLTLLSIIYLFIYTLFIFNVMKFPKVHSIKLRLDVHKSVHRNIKLTERTNKMRPCSKIYYSNVS
jgi:hypothetical protein